MFQIGDHRIPTEDRRPTRFSRVERAAYFVRGIQTTGRHRRWRPDERGIHRRNVYFVFDFRHTFGARFRPLLDARAPCFLMAVRRRT